MKNEKGIAGVDIVVSIIIITILLALIANIIANINIKIKETERGSTAISYVVQEAETIKAQGYKDEYNDKGLKNEDTLVDEDIYQNGEYTGYHKKITIKDYSLISQNENKKVNFIKEIKIEISYLLANKEQTVPITILVVNKSE